MNLLKLVLAGALLMIAPATAFAQNCAFVAGDTVFKEPNASDARIATFLQDLGPARTNAGINTRQLAEQVAVTMNAHAKLIDGIPAECRGVTQLANGFLVVNGLSGTFTDAEFAAKIRTTGFKVPTIMTPPASAPLPSSAAAQTPPAPIHASAAVHSAPATVQKIIERLPEAERKKIERLMSDQARIQKDIQSLKGKQEFTKADEARVKTLETNLAALDSWAVGWVADQNRRLNVLLGADGKGGHIGDLRKVDVDHDRRLDTLEARKSWSLKKDLPITLLWVFVIGCIGLFSVLFFVIFRRP